MKKIIFGSLFFASPSFALTEGWFVGASYYAQSSIFKTTQSADGSSSILGAGMIPFSATWSTKFWEYALAPKLEYTLIPRDSTGGSIQSTLMILSFPHYVPLEGPAGDYSYGLAFLQYTIKGGGGIKTLNNGTGTANFAVPPDSVTSTTVALRASLGLNFPLGHAEIGTFLEGAFTDRRTFSLFFNFDYKL
jgi:hypothetical protein